MTETQKNKIKTSKSRKQCCSDFVKSILIFSLFFSVIYIDAATKYIIPCIIYVLLYLLICFVLKCRYILIVASLSVLVKFYITVYNPIEKDLQYLPLIFDIQTFFSLSIFPFIFLLLNKYINRIEEVSIRDSLTNLYNSKYFTELLNYEIERCTRYNNWLTVVFFDIDNFKNINHLVGHISADKVLQKFSNILTQSVRKIDIVARMGGDEFAIILLETSPELSELIITRMRNKLKEKFIDLNMTCSFGLVSIDFSSVHKEYLAEDILEMSDIEMFKIKNYHKNDISHKIIQ
jgi:diguanylate cyclase (GGDEF)-like protein